MNTENWENEGGTVILENPYIRENNIREEAFQDYEYRLKKALDALKKAETKAKADAKNSASGENVRI